MVEAFRISGFESSGSIAVMNFISSVGEATHPPALPSTCRLHPP